MDITMTVNLMWDVATGICVGLLACGAWLCVEHWIEGDQPKESARSAAPAQPVFPWGGRLGGVD